MAKTKRAGEMDELAQLYQRAVAVQDAEARRLLTTAVARSAAVHSALDRVVIARDPRDASIVEALADKARESARSAAQGARAAMRGKGSTAAANKVAAEAIAAEAIAAEAIAAEATAGEPMAAEPLAAEPLAAEPLAAEAVQGVSADLLGIEFGNFLSKHGSTSKG